MKLRIRGNTLRLRITQSELDTLVDAGRVDDMIVFGDHQRLVYALVVSETLSALEARFIDNQITVYLPAGAVVTWAASDLVGFSHEQIVDGDTTLHILVEKDFQCLHRAPGADDADAFPHPQASA